jgi:O-antigen ligase
LLVWLFGLLANRREALRSSGIDVQLLVYVGICIASFVLGTAYNTSAADARLFVKLLSSIVFFFAVVNCVCDLSTLRRMVLALSLGGALAGAIAVWLYLLPATTATRLLATLSHVGYPDSNILQYDANSHVLKAIGTSIDHNILGATLMICGSLTVGLILMPGSRWRKVGLIAALGITVVALLLTYSRGSLFGFLIGCAVIATFRYRRLWLIAALILVAVPLVPELAQSSFVTHLEVGIQVQDQATAMRFGEYKDAFHLIAEYPWLGVGFGSAPDVDLYVGVSSIYLLIAENTGIVGLAAWLWTVGSIVIAAVRQLARNGVSGDPSSESEQATTLVVACLGAVASYLVAGLFDHHFVDLHQPHVVALVWLVTGLLAVGLRLGSTSTRDHPIKPDSTRPANAMPPASRAR